MIAYVTVKALKFDLASQVSSSMAIYCCKYILYIKYVKLVHSDFVNFFSHCIPQVKLCTEILNVSFPRVGI